MPDSWCDSPAYVTLHYPADVQISYFSVIFYSGWLIALIYLQHLLHTMVHWEPLNNTLPLTKGYNLVLFWDSYWCDHTVNRSVLVNILHCSFSKLLRLQRGRNHSAVLIRRAVHPLDQWVYVWIGQQSHKTSSYCKLLWLNTWVMCCYSLNKILFYRRTKLPTIIAIAV